MDSPDRLIRLREVQSQVGLGRSKIYAAIKDGKFPAPAKLTSRLVAWSEREVQDWVAARLQSRDTPSTA